ncbi:cytochrome ubiquinol oxidase subunit I, partial [Glaesserella parasuis]|uniref:cytochrome ubiquinol oxidase subunit I n=1 Tax=Glaesserella parasuis TaxID=738 RepID=UPI003F49C000
AGVVIAVAAWHLSRKQHIDIMRPALRFGLWFMIASFVGVFIAGDLLGLQMVATQPMKMASAEALYNTACGTNASFSIFSLGTPDGTQEIWSL